MFGAVGGRRYPDNLDAFLVVFLIVFLASVAAMVKRAKKDAAPAKGSDLVGYGVILAFCVLLFLFAQAIIG